jgi:competence protein ComER
MFRLQAAWQKEGLSMRIGLIGTGSMGSMLARAYCESMGSDTQILACNRTKAKLDALRSEQPRIQAIDTIQDMARLCDVLFLCVKPKDAWGILDTIQPLLTPNQYLISINSVISLRELEDHLPCRVVKIIPSITQEARSGIVLTMFGSRMTEQERDSAQRILENIGVPYEIPEHQVRIWSDLTSCGPAFFSFLIRECARAAAQIGQISQQQAESIVFAMLEGLVKLIREKSFTTEEVLRRVTVPGGVTASGLAVLDSSLYHVFETLFQTTKSHHPLPSKSEPNT